MEQPTITAESLAQFHSLFDEFEVLKTQASEALAVAKLNSELEIFITRDGKVSTVKEKDLWDEVWHLGAFSDAGEILNEKYPSVFEANRKAEAKKQEFQAFAKERWNIDPFGVSLSGIIRLIEGVVDYRLKQPG
jgi:hypothetical protein